MPPHVFENFWDKCIETYELGLALFLLQPGLALQACLKKIAMELELLTDVHMWLMLVKVIRGGIWRAIYQYATTTKDYLGNCNQNKETLYKVNFERALKQALNHEWKLENNKIYRI